ncbi:glutamine--fructose-6-phosphate transaminase (isomerizing) [Noviherbaspirillum agri]
MCGIVGAIAQRNVVPFLLEGLKRLEYRGYDSCGLAINETGVRRARTISRVADLQRQVAETAIEGSAGIAHTRWATHGIPNMDNAHPHLSRTRTSGKCIALVHNGIVENYAEIRDELMLEGYTFESQTDTEAVVHLVNRFYRGDLLAAVRSAVSCLEGVYALAVVCENEPHRMVGVRMGCPLVVGLGDGENFLASDVLALSGASKRIMYLEDGDIVDVQRQSVQIQDLGGNAVVRSVVTLDAEQASCDLGDYQHYMLKEIFEQPRAINETIKAMDGFSSAAFGAGAEAIFRDCSEVKILACGTSFYAGMTAKYWIEEIAGVPVAVEVASEYRYRKPAIDPQSLIVVVSQSGETADTLAALSYAKSLGHRNTLAICNVASSAIFRQAGLTFLTRAGTETGVASTKAFTTQLVALFFLAMSLAKSKGRLALQRERLYREAVLNLPTAIQAVLALEPALKEWAQEFATKENALFVARGAHYPIALEGALKLKEISYIHAEAYPAGELKHGPLALVTSAMPVITTVPNDALLGKLKSNMAEVRARGGELYVLADAGSDISAEPGLHVLTLPQHYGVLSPIQHVVPLQLLAYHTALARGADVDKPRNLAKSVTVE